MKKVVSPLPLTAIPMPFAILLTIWNVLREGFVINHIDFLPHYVVFNALLWYDKQWSMYKYVYVVFSLISSYLRNALSHTDCFRNGKYESSFLQSGVRQVLFLCFTYSENLEPISDWLVLAFLYYLTSNNGVSSHKSVCFFYPVAPKQYGSVP